MKGWPRLQVQPLQAKSQCGAVNGTPRDKLCLDMGRAVGVTRIDRIAVRYKEPATALLNQMLPNLKLCKPVATVPLNSKVQLESTKLVTYVHARAVTAIR